MLTIDNHVFYKEQIAQQPKAYETVKYIATARNIVFHLDYTDGYIGASKILMPQTNQKRQLFSPKSGTPEADGNCVLQSNADAEKLK